MFSENHLRIASVSLAGVALAMAVVGSACRREPQAGAQTAAAQRAADQPPTMRTIEIPVDGMICQVCAGTVKRALKTIDGVKDAEISLEKRNAVVRYDERKVTLATLTRVIKDAGFRPGEPTTPPSQ